MRLSRRALLKDGMMVVSAGMVMPAIFSRGVASAQSLAGEGARLSLAATDRVLIVVQMAGGNDGLNTVVPYTDATYRKMRPTLAIPGEKVLQLDGRLGLHQNLAPLKNLWDQGHMAIIEGVGYPNQSLSHFQTMDIWQTLDLNGTGTEGWLGKMVSGWVDKDGHPFRAMDIGSQTAQALASISAPVPTLTNTKNYRVQPDPVDLDGGNARMQALMKLYNTYPKSSPYAALLDATALGAHDGALQLSQADSAYQPSVTYPKNSFAAGLQVLAEAIVQGLGLRVGYVTLGGFDTHANEQPEHDMLMTTLADGLAAFYQDLNQHGKGDNVMIMTWSEFGRRVEENGSQGTDHGTAAPMFMLGKGISKGIYGEPPDLQNLDHNGNLKYTTDFRSVYATVLDNWMGASSKDVLGATYDTQKFILPS
ncbi:DUF1501 domain-containing protein [Tengunoibacter tsumagoiensis]|uniref:DUF1501 domain-containing protein n=1 Tax=Tengunoibacter tsumagoiensis TaxID=2014871 RepID=A0A402A2F7_9CHLR|nr:DUF1501 domain-containing protein [Tengunoibacter tsumagoiensis]GCE13327.1 hypothetical protein KTT_31860 [Tengunoibacter tsumagoiensis]